MKFNIDVDITPDELRRFMGLPDVHEWQQQFIDSFAENMQQSQEQQWEFARNMLAGGFATSLNMFNAMAQDSSPRDAK